MSHFSITTSLNFVFFCIFNNNMYKLCYFINFLNYAILLSFFFKKKKPQKLKRTCHLPCNSIFLWKQKRQLRFRSQSRIRKSKTLYLIFKMMQFNFYQKKTKSMNEWDPHVYHLLDRRVFNKVSLTKSNIFLIKRFKWPSRK